ncbi:unnamed protein product [Lactuca virosa]|uniref:Cytochrome b-c1 complex subunit 7 n=1 Tax=Lactuca virosa TaxID=75947 RepID=A0AAU9PH17_9ASTR|nr:unnamed protein product [Lactuca virosa]
MATSQLVRTILDPTKNWFAAVHKKTITERLRKYGLRYDDLFDPMECLDIKEAMRRLPREIIDARNQRIFACNGSLHETRVSPQRSTGTTDTI